MGMERVLIFKMIADDANSGLDRSVRFVATKNIQATNIGDVMTYQESLDLAKRYQAEFMFCDSCFLSCK